MRESSLHLPARTHPGHSPSRPPHIRSTHPMARAGRRSRSHFQVASITKEAGCADGHASAAASDILIALLMRALSSAAGTAASGEGASAVGEERAAGEKAFERLIDGPRGDGDMQLGG